MRPEARIKSGFYPAPADAISHVMQYLRPPEGRFAILDPCAGQGDAIVQIASALGCQWSDTYAIELDRGRADSLQSTLGQQGGNVLAPADYFGVSMPSATLSFVWCNPPFDDEYGGGGRVEREFLQQSTNQLKTNGIIALVCPYKTAQRSDIRTLLKTWFDDVSTVPFPDACRRYNEVVMLGIKRHTMESYWNRHDHLVFLSEPRVYDIPKSRGPAGRFLKIQMTEDELEESFAASPLNEYLKPPVPSQLVSPPLELGTGHLALLLASGHLDGLVCPPDGPPHVVRGTARKAEYVKETERKEEKGGTMTNKTVIGEKIELIIRAVDAAGEIKTFTNKDAPLTVPLPQDPLPQPTRPARQEPEPEVVIAPVAPQPEALVTPGGRAFDVD